MSIDPDKFLSVAHRAVSSLSGHSNLQELLPGVLEASCEAVSASEGRLWLYDPTTEKLVLAARNGAAAGAELPASNSALLDSVVEEVFRSGTSLLRGGAGAEGSIPAAIIVPVRHSAGPAIGVLQARRRLGEGEFSRSDLLLLEASASLVAAVIENARKEEGSGWSALAEVISPPEAESVAGTIRRVCETLAPAARERGITLTWEGECPPFQHRPAQLFQAIYSLIHNALPHIAPGGSIKVILSHRENFAEIAVADTGMAEDIPAGEFTQKVLSTTMGDAGFGSRVSASLAAWDNGAVLVESIPGQGATFRLRFPLLPVVPADTAAVSSGNIIRQASTAISRSDVLAAIHRIATRLFARPSVDELLPEVLAASLEAVDALGGTIWLYDPKDDHLVVRHAQGGAGEKLIGLRLPASVGIVGAVFRSGQPVFTRDAGEDPRHVEIAKDFRTEWLVSIPLRNLGGQTIGVMQVLNKINHGPTSTDQERVILETMASLAAAAISNAQQAEQARMAAVAESVGDIAHEIKNIMTPIEVWMAMLEPLAGECRVALARLEAITPPEGSRDLAIISDVLNLLPEAAQAIREKSQEARDRGIEIADALKGSLRDPHFIVDPPLRTVGRVCHTLRPVAESRGATLLLEGTCPAFPHDRSHLYRAIYNLVHNAILHTYTGGSVRVIIGQEGEFAQFTVVDTGEGMSPEIRDKLFTEKAVSATPGGSGLGSRIVAKVAKEHRGSVEVVESIPGKGTTIRLLLPMGERTD